MLEQGTLIVPVPTQGGYNKPIPKSRTLRKTSSVPEPGTSDSVKTAKTNKINTSSSSETENKTIAKKTLQTRKKRDQQNEVKEVSFGNKGKDQTQGQRPNTRAYDNRA